VTARLTHERRLEAMRLHPSNGLRGGDRRLRLVARQDKGIYGQPPAIVRRAQRDLAGERSRGYNVIMSVTSPDPHTRTDGGEHHHR
jgi:hypothetical protein